MRAPATPANTIADRSVGQEGDDHGVGRPHGRFHTGQHDDREHNRGQSGVQQTAARKHSEPASGEHAFQHRNTMP